MLQKNVLFISSSHPLEGVRKMSSIEKAVANRIVLFLF